VVSVERQTFPALIAAGALVMGYVDPAYWLDVGTPEAFVQGSCDLVLGRLESPALRGIPGIPGERLLLPGGEVAGGSSVGGGTVISPGAVVEAGATVTTSVIFEGARVGPGAVVANSVLGKDVRVGAGAVLDGAVIGDGASVAGGNELRAGIRVWPGVELGPTAIRFSTDARLCSLAFGQLRRSLAVFVRGTTPGEPFGRGAARSQPPRDTVRPLGAGRLTGWRRD
jgi:mannose-1-phosphate guanylyltransferase